MSEINTGSDSANQNKQTHFHFKKQSTRVDMTPMVDLGFLLITFFIFTTTMIKPVGMNVNRPVNDGPPTPVPQSQTLTLLIGSENKVFWYMGRNDNEISAQINVTDYSTQGLGKLIRQKDAEIRNLKDVSEQANSDNSLKGIYIIVKPLDNSVFKNMIDVLDEIKVNRIENFTWTDASYGDLALLKKNGWNK